MATATTTELTTAPQDQAVNTGLAVHKMNASSLAFLTDPAAFNHLWRVATGYSRSQMVPMQFRSKPDDCFIICQLALRLEVDPFMLMQATYIVHGKPGFEAKMAIALLNASGKIKGTLKTSFSGDGDSYGCEAWCIDRETGEKVTGPKVDWRMVKAEGWNKREGSKWNTMPGVMFIYRAASYLIRTNYPEVLMGMPTVEEVEDTTATDRRALEITNQERLDLLLSGTPDKPQAESEEVAPPTTLEATSQTGPRELATGESAELPSETEAANPDADVLQEWSDSITSAETDQHIETLRGQVDTIKCVHNETARTIRGWLDKRQAALHPQPTRRGPGRPRQNLLDGGTSQGATP
jgi:hypothetical protein